MEARRGAVLVVVVHGRFCIRKKRCFAWEFLHTGDEFAGVLYG
jgi:hypothetical protein